LIGFREHVREIVQSRSRLRRSSPLGPFTGWRLCFPPGRPPRRLLTRWRNDVASLVLLALPQGEGVMRLGFRLSAASFFYCHRRT
jgi:hypothetical protein